MLVKRNLEYVRSLYREDEPKAARMMLALALLSLDGGYFPDVASVIERGLQHPPGTYASNCGDILTAEVLDLFGFQLTPVQPAYTTAKGSRDGRA